MDQGNLKSLLQQLESELRATDTTDPRNRALLQRLADDIRPLLADKIPPPPHYHGLRDRLTEAATAFEAEHPRLGATMENVINLLARLNL
jgi:ABC-type transporter Mla subunit MlaD